MFPLQVIILLPACCNNGIICWIHPVENTLKGLMNLAKTDYCPAIILRDDLITVRVVICNFKIKKKN